MKDNNDQMYNSLWLNSRLYLKHGLPNLKNMTNYFFIIGFKLIIQQHCTMLDDYVNIY